MHFRRDSMRSVTTTTTPTTASLFRPLVARLTHHNDNTFLVSLLLTHLAHAQDPPQGLHHREHDRKRLSYHPDVEHGVPLTDPVACEDSVFLYFCCPNPKDRIRKHAQLMWDFLTVILPRQIYLHLMLRFSSLYFQGRLKLPTLASRISTGYSAPVKSATVQGIGVHE
ncbi:hypothetical protein EDD16DRAFT_1644304 [Pisolithus croceorrhizus]|nr:hypothetical protein EDD16DRAFT_1644304 [Pisolithus croceorrhizus]